MLTTIIFSKNTKAFYLALYSENLLLLYLYSEIMFHYSLIILGYMHNICIINVHNYLELFSTNKQLMTCIKGYMIILYTLVNLPLLSFCNHVIYTAFFLISLTFCMHLHYHSCVHYLFVCIRDFACFVSTDPSLSPPMLLVLSVPEPWSSSSLLLLFIALTFWFVAMVIFMFV